MNQIQVILVRIENTQKWDSLKQVPKALSTYYLEDEQRWQIAKNENGNPFFTHPDRENTSLSISHTKGVAAIAIQDECMSLGVDIEMVDRTLSERVIDYYYHPNEIQWLQRQKEIREPAIQLWTLKEAFAKAIGRGINRKILATDFLPALEILQKKQTIFFNSGYFSCYLSTLQLKIGDRFLQISICSEQEPKIIQSYCLD